MVQNNEYVEENMQYAELGRPKRAVSKWTAVHLYRTAVRRAQNRETDLKHLFKQPYAPCTS
jgi:hypothetical protein